MSFIEEMIGVTLEMKQEEMELVVADLLIDGEKLVKGYQVIRDLLIFTDKRILIVDYLGLRGKKIEYQIIPYKNVIRFTIETPGSMDTDYTLKIYVLGSIEPVEKQLKKDINIHELNHILFSYMLT